MRDWGGSGIRFKIQETRNKEQGTRKTVKVSCILHLTSHIFHPLILESCFLSLIDSEALLTEQYVYVYADRSG